MGYTPKNPAYQVINAYNKRPAVNERGNAYLGRYNFIIIYAEICNENITKIHVKMSKKSINDNILIRILIISKFKVMEKCSNSCQFCRQIYIRLEPVLAKHTNNSRAIVAYVFWIPVCSWTAYPLSLPYPPAFRRNRHSIGSCTARCGLKWRYCKCNPDE